MQTFRKDQDVIDYLAPAVIVVGQVVHLGDGLHGVAIAAIASGATGALRTTGVFQMDALTAGVWAIGDKLYWDATNSEITDVSLGHREIGLALNAKVATTQTAALVLLNSTSPRAEEQLLIAAGAIDIDARYVALSVASGTYAVTLAAPSRPGLLMVIEMIDATGTSVTLALTEIIGGTAATTATFDAANETLTIISIGDKWVVLDEHGVTLS